MFFNDVSSVSVCALCFLPCHWAPPRRIWLPFLYSRHQVFIHVDKIPESLLWSRLNSSSSPNPLSSDRCSKPLIIFVALRWTCCSAHPCLSFTGEPSTGPSIQMCFSRAKKRRITSLALLAGIYLMQPKMLLALCHKGMWLAHGQLAGTCLKSFSANPLSSQSTPSPYWCLRLFLPRCKTLHFELL